MRPGLNSGSIGRLTAISLLSISLAIPAAAQFGGPHTTTSVGPYHLAPAPSVTSIGGRYTPNILPSVTSIPNYGYHYGYGPYFNNGYKNGGYYGGRYRGGYGYVIPYYYPVDSSSYGYDYVGGGGGPDLYSGPPVGPTDPNYHMIVEQPPVGPYDNMPEQAYAPPMAAPVPQPPTAPPPEVKPGEPTVLVFRNGKQQQVTNYAIMGDSLYVFDQGRKKIALADLDIPATVKANDDRGMEFRVPPSAKKKATTTTVPQNATPDQNQTTTPPPNIAAVMP